MKYSISIVITGLLTFTSCTKMTNDFKEINLECGLESDFRASSSRYFKILNEDGSPLEDSQLNTTQARVIFSDSSQEQLSLTRSGCVVPKNMSGVLQVLSKGKAGWMQLTHSIEKFENSSESAIFEKVRLELPAGLEQRLKCPDGAYFSNVRFLPLMEGFESGRQNSLDIRCP